MKSDLDMEDDEEKNGESKDLLKSQFPSDFWELMEGNPKIIENLKKIKKNQEQDSEIDIEELIEPPEEPDPLEEDDDNNQDQETRGEGTPVGTYDGGPTGNNADFDADFKGTIPFKRGALFKPIKASFWISQRTRGIRKIITLFPNRSYRYGNRLFREVKKKLLKNIPCDISKVITSSTPHSDRIMLYNVCLASAFSETLYHELTHYYLHNYAFRWFLRDPIVDYNDAKNAWAVWQKLYDKQKIAGNCLEESICDANALVRLSRKTSWAELKKIPGLWKLYSNEEITKKKLKLYAYIALWGLFLMKRPFNYRHFAYFLNEPYSIIESCKIIDKINYNIGQYKTSSSTPIKSRLIKEGSFQFELHPRTINCVQFNLQSCLLRVKPKILGSSSPPVYLNAAATSQLNELIKDVKGSKHLPPIEYPFTFWEPILENICKSGASLTLTNAFDRRIPNLMKSWHDWDKMIKHPGMKPVWKNSPLQFHPDTWTWDLFPPSSISATDQNAFPYRIGTELPQWLFPSFNEMLYIPNRTSSRFYTLPLPEYYFDASP